MASSRQSILASRHRALGSELGDWNGMDVAWEYDQPLADEHRAVRETAGLFDVSGLKKIHVTGPDAQAALNHLCTRDIYKLYPGKSVYALILDDSGGITDDCIIFYIMPNNFMMVHGSGYGLERLQDSAQGKDVSIEFDDNLHNISLQGPKALEFLDQHTPTDLASLKYFHHVPTTVFGQPCLLSRTGYSGERGYEIFADADAVAPIWDSILEQGKTHGIIPCSFNCIDTIRVEAALLFYPYDMTEKNTPWEMGLGFTVSKKKEADFRGKDALFASRGKERVKTYGIVADAEQALDEDAEVYADGKKIGHVTAPMYTAYAGQSLAMAQIDPAYAEPGNEVEVRGSSLTCKATTHSLPFYDPSKSKRTE